MAGGFGKRLRPLTKNTPKPMIKVANKPIMQHILENAISQGFHNFYVSINYLKNKIERYFGDGTKFGANISYIKENKPLGTAGSLYLLNNKDKLPIVVVNGDTVTDVNFKSLINYHKKNSSDFTIVTNLERKKASNRCYRNKIKQSSKYHRKTNSNDKNQYWYLCDE